MSRILRERHRRNAWPVVGALALALLWGLSVVFVAGCTTNAAAPIVQKTVTGAESPRPTGSARTKKPKSALRPKYYVVQSGDTVHGIAFRFHLDHRAIVGWNNIRNPNLIFVGQRLRLFAPPTAVRPPQVNSQRVPQSQARTAPASTQSTATKRGSKPAPAKVESWHWPAKGKTSKSKAASGALALEIRGEKGQPVTAAASGAVVYSGSGLRGYGELIIVKHNETFLSAYAHNKNRLVKEGQHVKAGQLIAHMGDTESRDVMLHFEIRRDGTTVDPLRYLPKR